MDVEGLSSEAVKGLERETEHASAFCAEIKNGGAIPLLPLSLPTFPAIQKISDTCIEVKELFQFT
jgi:hypothetical protein